jgi:hypothetical protein
VNFVVFVMIFDKFIEDVHLFWPWNYLWKRLVCRFPSLWWPVIIKCTVKNLPGTIACSTGSFFWNWRFGTGFFGGPSAATSIQLQIRSYHTTYVSMYTPDETWVYITNWVFLIFLKIILVLICFNMPVWKFNEQVLH